MGVEANFGVIDAQGGAAYYETTNFSFKKIDANDPAIAPFGYIIRTNYSFSGAPDEGYGYIRYLNAEELFYMAAAENNLTYQFLVTKLSRSLKHSLLALDLESLPLPAADSQKFVPFLDYIPRYTSVTTMVVQGVKPAETPDLTTIWTILGFPLCSVVTPTWVTGGENLPAMLKADETGNAPLCQKSLMLKKKCFPVSRGSGSKYLNLSALINSDKSGILQALRPLETEIINLSEKYLQKWRKKGMDVSEVKDLYRQLSETTLNEYKLLFDL
jgi:hypothetical protein